MESKTAPRRSSILLGERHTSVFNRFIARAIDLLIAVAIYFLGAALWQPLGIGAAALFSCFQDGWGVGQSVGKRIVGLRIIDDATGMSGTFRNSLLRNVPFWTAVVFAAVPALWVFFIFVSVPLLSLEIYLLLTLESGVRLGDVLGGTLVTEYVIDSFENIQDA